MADARCPASHVAAGDSSLSADQWGSILAIHAPNSNVNRANTNSANTNSVPATQNLTEVPLKETFDVILAGEMIEHLSNPGLFLRGIKRFMNRETILLITTINAYCGMRNVIYALRGKGGKNEPVHQDHVAYYSYSTLKLLVERVISS